MFTWQFWRGFLVHLKEPCCVPRTKSLGTTVLGRSGRAYCSVYKLQDGTEYGLTTTSLISSVSYFNLGVVDLFGRANQRTQQGCVLGGDGTQFGPAVTAWAPHN